MIAKAGAGPVPVPFKQMTAESLANSITFALQDSVQVAVQKMAASIAEALVTRCEILSRG
jgi:sterol 3beta-glucosyltransferase